MFHAKYIEIVGVILEKQINQNQKDGYWSIPDIFRTPHFFAKKHETFAINRDWSKKAI